MEISRARYMKKSLQSLRLFRCLVLAGMFAGSALADAVTQEPSPGETLSGLLALARERNPDYAAVLREADAAVDRIVPAGALPDPKLRAELMDITRGGMQNATLLPGRAGSTRYTLMQDVPWFGKRDLRREIAELEAAGATGRAMGTWNELSARIKTTYAQMYFLAASERLDREILDLMLRLEKVAQARYAGGLAAQQDVIRAQLEQTAMRNELITVETERHHLHTRMNALLGRPPRALLASPASLRPLPAPARLDFSALEDRVRAKNPVIFAEESRVQMAEKSRELAYKDRYPDFTLGLAPNQFQNSVRQWDVMIEVNIPLQQSSRRAREHEVEAMLDVARSRRDATANQVLGELSESLAALDAARRIEMLATDSLLPQAELTFQSALAGYETGKVDFATLLDARKQIWQARLRQIKARAEGQARLADIERIVGEDL